MGIRIIAALAVVFVLISGSAQADPIRDIEPDDFSAGTDISTAFSGVTLSVVSSFVNPEVYSLTATNGTASTGSRVFGYEAGVFPDSWSSPNVDFRADFATPTNFLSIDAIANDFSDPVQVLIYDSGDNELDSTTTDGSGTDTVQFSRTFWDISYVIVQNPAANQNETYLLDNLRIGVVPEPATLLLFGIGLVGVAAVRRRRRRAR